MSWPPLKNTTTAASDIDAACAGAVRRMVNLPRSVIGEVSRAVSRGFNLIGNSASHRRHLLQPPPLPPPLYYLRQPEIPVEGGEWQFLHRFEQGFGSFHPFFYACTFRDVLRMAEDEGKPVFVYLHSPEHPFTSTFCRDTLCAEAVVEFLDANFLSWGAVADMGEGLHLAQSLRPACFPFSTIVSASGGGVVNVLRQMEGPVSSYELIEIAQSIVGGERGDFVSLRDMRGEDEKSKREVVSVEEDKKDSPPQFSALQIEEEEDMGGSTLRTRIRHKGNTHEHAQEREKPKSVNGGKKAPDSTLTSGSGGTNPNNLHYTQMLIRLPNGDRMEKCFCKDDNIGSVYGYVDALGLPGLGSYRLVSYFPRRVFDSQTRHLTLLEAGFYPRATLFVKPNSSPSSP